MFNKIKRVSNWIFERYTPLVASIAITYFIIKMEIDFMSNEHFKNMLDGSITLLSIIIGFIGAMVPVIISMKTDSTFVQYLFEKDKDELFKKYLKRNLTIGILASILNLSLYVYESFVGFEKYIYYAWIFTIIYFLLLTLRSLKFMIDIIFKEDDDDDYSLNETISKEE